MSEELAKKEANTAMERPDYLKGKEARGTEHVKKDDLQVPRLALAQKMSPEIEPVDSKYIKGLEVGMMFNSLNKEILGKGPLYFTVLRGDPPRWIEFVPRDQGGGVKDPNVQEGDPRTKFQPDGKPPLATKFYDFIILLLQNDRPPTFDDVIALSFKSTGLKTARLLNGLMKMRDADIWAGRYELGTAFEKKKANVWAVYTVKNAGWVSPEVYAFGENVYNSIKNKPLDIERDETPDPEDASFDPEKLERESQAAQTAAGGPAM